VDAHNAQIWIASVVIGIEPKSAQIGGSAPVIPRKIQLHSVSRSVLCCAKTLRMV